MLRLLTTAGLPTLLIVLDLIISAHAFAQEGERLIGERRVPAYCGIYSVYGALNAVGINSDFADFASAKYVTSRFGSTIEDLKKAAEDHGAYAKPCTNLTAADLKMAPCPVILHVADERRIGVYNHWILFLGTQDGRARIVDAPHNLELISYADLLARWDSTGLFITNEPSSLADQSTTNWLRGTLVVAMVVLVSAAGQRRKTRRQVHAFMTVVAILGTSVALAVAYHLLAPEGLLRNASAVELVQHSHLPVTIPEIGKDAMAELIGRREGVIIDARREDDFGRGHIPGSINVPITASRDERRYALHNIAKDAKIVLYCQSDQCGYADDVSRSLLMDGYQNVSVYRGGWVVWNEKKQDE